MKLELAGLSAHVLGPVDATAAKVTCVLLHGFGAGGDDLVPLAAEVDAPGVRWVFPAAPLALAGVYGDARAWWMLDLARLERDLARGDAAVRRDEVPDGLLPARAQLLRLLDEVVARFGDGPIILGGFSQGSMLALDVALHRAAPLAGLVLMSTTLINAGDWLPRLPGLRGVPVIQSHGRADGLLPFAVADGLRALLVEAGAEITWQPFDGGHEIPGETIDAIGALLGRVG